MENLSTAFTLRGGRGFSLTRKNENIAVTDRAVITAFDISARVHGTTPEAAIIATKEKPAADARKAALATLARAGYTYRKMSETTGSSIRSVGRAVATHHRICTIDAAYRAKWHVIVAEFKAVEMTAAAMSQPPTPNQQGQ